MMFSHCVASMVGAKELRAVLYKGYELKCSFKVLCNCSYATPLRVRKSKFSICIRGKRHVLVIDEKFLL